MIQAAVGFMVLFVLFVILPRYLLK